MQYVTKQQEKGIDSIHFDYNRNGDLGALHKREKKSCRECPDSPPSLFTAPTLPFPGDDSPESQLRSPRSCDSPEKGE